MASYFEKKNKNCRLDQKSLYNTVLVKAIPSKKLEIFRNPNPERDYEIRMECPEFTCLCPKTGQPDFATVEISYIPDKVCLELKSLKLYMWSYRYEGVFHETVINKILNDLTKLCNPRRMKVVGKFNVRGGINSTVIADYEGEKRVKTKKKK